MTIKTYFLVLTLMVSSYVGFSQTQNWVMQITATGGDNFSCIQRILSRTIKLTYNGSTYQSSSAQVSVPINSSDGIYSGTITATYSETLVCYDSNGDPLPDCSCGTNSGNASTTLSISHTPSDGEGCVSSSNGSNTSANVYVYVTATIYRKMASPTVPSSADCSQSTVTLSSPSTASSASSYLWQVTDDPSKNNWQTITGKNTQNISVSANDLNKSVFTASTRYVRVNDTGCTGRLGLTSNSFQVYVPAPTAVSLTWTDPPCFGYDSGSVKINSVTGSVTTYRFSLYYIEPTTNAEGLLYQKSIAASSLPVTINKSDIIAQGYQTFGIKSGKWKMLVENFTSINAYGTCSINEVKTITEPSELNVTLTPSDYNGYAIRCNGESNGSISSNVSGGTPGYTYSWSNGSTAASISGLGAGAYTLTVKDTKGCSKSPSATLSAPAILSLSFPSFKAPSCNESSDGELTAAATGGVASYAYVWSTAETGATAHNLAKGSYSVTVTDANSCTTNGSTNLTAPAAMVVTAQGSPPTCVNGSDGRAWVSDVQNAPGPVTYLWNTTDNSNEIFNLTKGSYSVTVSSVNGTETCTGSATVQVTDPTPWTVQIKPDLVYNGKAIRCNGESNGRLDAEVKNDQGQIVSAEFYTWSNGESGSSVKYIDDLSEGSYDVTVKYNGICEAGSSYSLFDPEPVTGSISANSSYNGQIIRCHDETNGSIKVTPAGGTGVLSDYTYLWNTTATTAVLSSIGPGDYSVTVTDKNGCTGSNNFTVNNPSPVEALIFSFSDYTGYGVSCLGSTDGYITSGGLGGTGVYSYAWSSGQSTSQIINLGADSYILTVSDNNGCQGSANVTLTAPSALTLGVDSKQNVSCFNGSDGVIVLAAGGGAGQYEYSRDNTVWQSSSTFSGLPVNSYTLYVRDANTCGNTVSETLTQPTQLKIDFTDIEPAFCSNPVGKATGVVSGGVGNYVYDWKSEGGSATLSTTANLTNVAAGIYHLYVRDGNNCPVDNNIPISSTDGAKTTYVSMDAKCFDSSDGSATIEITAGDGPFEIGWPDGQNTLEGTNLKKGTYYVLVTDVHDCTIVQVVDVNAPDPIQLAKASETNPTCNTFCDGEITLAASGGVGNYVYEWNSSTGATQTQLCAGTYSVTVKDGNNCTLVEDIGLTEPAAVSVWLVKETLPTCKDGCDGSLEITGVGGNGGYQYVWTAGGNTNIKDNICAGSYEVKITDVKGCVGAGTLTLNNTPALPVYLGGGVTLCVGQRYSLDAGSGWKNIWWKGVNGFTSNAQKITIQDPGQYTLEVESQAGCFGGDTFILETSLDLLQANFAMAAEAHAGDTVVLIDVSWPLPDKIEWIYPVEMKKVFDNGDVIYGQFDETGTYEVKLKANLAECKDEMSKTITILEAGEGPIGGRLGYQAFVKEFTLYANPNNGQFDVVVEVSEISPVTISVWQTTTSYLMAKVTEDDHNHYRMSFDLRPLSSGTYVLRLDHAHGKQYIRFVVK